MIAKYGPPFKIFTLVAQLVKNLPAMHETGFHHWVGKTPWRRDSLPTPVFLGFPGDSASKESVCNVGDLSLIPGLGRPPEEGKGYPLQYSGLKNIVHGVTKSWTRLSDFQDHLCQRTYHLVQDSPRRNKGEPGPAPAGQACCRPEQPPSLTHA